MQKMINERVVFRLYSWPVANYDVIILEHSLFPSHKHLHTNALGQLSPSERTRDDASTTKTKMSSTFRIVFLHATLTTVETRGGRQRKSVEIPDVDLSDHQKTFSPTRQDTSARRYTASKCGVIRVSIKVTGLVVFLSASILL